MEVDWLAIKTEYITTDIGYRKLAAKYGVTEGRINKIGKDEGWVKQREQYRSKTAAKALEKISKQQSDAQAARAKRLMDVADEALEKVAAKVRAINPETVEARDMRAICATLLDLQELMRVRSDLDDREQRARIANLERQADKESAGKEAVQVVMDERLDELCQ